MNSDADIKKGKNSSWILEYAEKTLIIIPSVYFLSKNYNSLFNQYNIISICYFFETILDVFFTTFRKGGDISPNKKDWLLAVLGTYSSLIVSTQVGGANIAPIKVCLIFCILGIFTSISAKICLGRSFAIVAALRMVKTYGPYRFIRHPMYAGYMLTSIGFLLYNFRLWNIMAIACTWFIQILRIQSEEKILSTDKHWQQWSQKVRWKLLPFIY